MICKSLCTALLGLLVSPAIFAAAQQRIETITAQVHSEMARAADSLPSVKSHFHHVVNCLVDPDSRSFDVRADNPCAGMGSGGGALHDETLTDGQRKELLHAVEIAERGAHSTSIEVAHVYAEWLSDVLKRNLP
jgi:hypothetical protein